MVTALALKGAIVIILVTPVLFLYDKSKCLLCERLLCTGAFLGNLETQLARLWLSGSQSLDLEEFCHELKNWTKWKL